MSFSPNPPTLLFSLPVALPTQSALVDPFVDIVMRVLSREWMAVYARSATRVLRREVLSAQNVFPVRDRL
jgi:hypothetical protein